MGASITKELLITIPFTVDALNTFITFPLFVIKGRQFVLENITSKDDKISLSSEVQRPAFRQLWDLFMITYEGYFGFTASTLICIYKIPESIPIFAYSLFGLYAYKMYALLKSKGLGGDKNDPQYKAKVASIAFFFLPSYGGYCGLHLLEYLRNTTVS